MCVCVCVCVCESAGTRKRERHHADTTWKQAISYRVHACMFMCVYVCVCAAHLLLRVQSKAENHSQVLTAH